MRRSLPIARTTTSPELRPTRIRTVHGVENRAGLFGIAIGQELHRSLEIREENRHLLALAFEGALGGEDPVREMLGGVGVGRAKPGLRTFAQPGAAVPAELVARRIRGPARRAGGLERGSALPAKTHAGKALSLAAGTFHGAASSESGRSR